METEDYGVRIGQLEELLQKITATMTSDVIFEKLLPSDLWDRCKNDITSLLDLAESLKKSMLLLKPERVPTIEKRFQDLLLPLNDFKEALLKKSDDPLANSRLALERLRRVVIEGSDFLDLAKEIEKNPSESILAVLKLKEVYGAKEYLSTVTIPETVHVRFAGLSKKIEDLKARISILENALEELGKHLDSLQEEMSSFRPSPTEVSSTGRTSVEPSLVSSDRK